MNRRRRQRRYVAFRFYYFTRRYLATCAARRQRRRGQVLDNESLRAELIFIKPSVLRTFETRRVLTSCRLDPTAFHSSFRCRTWLLYTRDDSQAVGRSADNLRAANTKVFIVSLQTREFRIHTVPTRPDSTVRGRSSDVCEVDPSVSRRRLKTQTDILRVICENLRVVRCRIKNKKQKNEGWAI